MLFFYALLNLIGEGIARILAELNIHNHIVYNILDVVNITVYYWGIRQGTRVLFIHKVIFGVVLTMSVFAIYHSYSFINAYSYLMIYGYIGFVSLIILFQLTSPDQDAPMELGLFWLMCGFIIYSFSTLSLYFLLKYILFNTDWGIIYFRMYNLFIMLITIGMFSKSLLWKNRN
ncbi:MAG: hypothetical protein V4651_00405 [Bacteroidota bacterium]